MISKICNLIITMFITFTIIAASLLILPKIFGYQIYGVLSGSMEPSYPVGSIVYVKVIDPREAKVGDTISFHIEGNDSVVATHRIVEINEDENNFLTKGDANEVMDQEPVSFHDFIGVVKFRVPYFGYIAMYIQTKQGLYASIGVFLFIIFLSLLGDVMKKQAIEETVNMDDILPDEKV